MKKTWKWIGAIIAVAIVAVVLVVRVRQPVPVEVKRMRPETFTVRVVEAGVTKAEAEYTVYPRYQDRVVSMLVEEGDRVEEGQLLLVLDSRDLDYAAAELEGRLHALAGEELKLTEQPGAAAVAEHELAIRQAEARREAAERSYRRIAQLHREQSATDEEYDEARYHLTDMEYALQRSREALGVLRESYDPPPGSHEVIDGRRTAYQAQIDRNRYRAGEYKIHAPADGVVGRLQPEKNELVDPQTPLLTVFQDDRLEVEVDVLAREAFDLKIGMSAELLLDRHDREVEFPGTIIKIAPQAEKDLSPLGLEERRVKVTIAPEIPEDLVVGPGREVDVTFITRTLADAMAVPKRSLFTDQGEDALFVVENGRARVRRVVTGLSSRRLEVIEQGLQEGDLVILDPRTEGLREGARVVVQTHSPHDAASPTE